MKRKVQPSPPRLPHEQALAAYCHDCFSMPGETCRNFLGHAKAPCRQRGYTAPAAPAKPRGLFDIQPEPDQGPPQDTAAAAAAAEPAEALPDDQRNATRELPPWVGPVGKAALCKSCGATCPNTWSDPRGYHHADGEVYCDRKCYNARPQGYSHDSGEGPFNTWAEALDFAEAECGAAYQVTQAPDGRWRIMLRDPAPTLGILVERDDMMEGTVFHWSLIDLGTGSPVESGTVPCADEAQAYAQARARAAELGRTIDPRQCMTEDMTI